MKEETTKGINTVAMVFVCFVGIAGAFIGTALFFTGFHNVDLSFNACVIANDIDIDFRDWKDQYSVTEEPKPMIDFYIIGMNYMIYSVGILFVSGMCICYMLSEIFERRKQ